MTSPPVFVYFDLDDTLLDHRGAERAALADCHARFADGLGRHPVEHVQATYHAHNVPLWKQYATGEIGRRDVERLRFERTLVALGSGLDAEEVGRHYMARYAEHWRWTDGAERAFHAVADRLPVGLLTNGFVEVQRAKLARFPALLERAAAVVVSEEVGVMKPHPRIFAHATERAGVEPAEILYVGDSLSSDVEGGLAAGWRVAWYGGDGSTSGGDCSVLGGRGGDPATIVASHTLVEDGTCITPGVDGNLSGDPLLGPLADNGGPTLTHLPELGSPLIDAGDNATCLSEDQRGLPRDDGSCDIGSVERQQVVADYDLEATPTTPLTTQPGGSVSFAYAITNSTAASVSGDPYFVAETSTGQTVSQGRIRTGTLPGGGAVAGSYTQPVPQSAPGGVYTYRLVIGSFPSGSVDEEVFALTVSSTTVLARAGGAGGEIGDVALAGATKPAGVAKPAGATDTLRSGGAGWAVTEPSAWVVVASAEALAEVVGEAAAEALAEIKAESEADAEAEMNAKPDATAEEAETAEPTEAAASAVLPAEVALHAPYPNPAAGTATLGFDLPEAARVRLTVYDVLGREVARLADGELQPGRHTAVLDGWSVPAGTYLVRLTADGGFTQTHRLTLLQ